MALAELNVRIGAIYKDFDKSLKGIERSMMRFSGRISQVGNDMTTALTLPLAAFGAKAIQAAADAESMRLAIETTMKDAGYSIQEAGAELEKLRTAALAPGLDFQQAVKGSIRLQNVGFSAEKSRDILIQMANAVAMAGGSAQELDGVTRQFGQMIAKGRVLQEDLTIIQENMPGISKAMEEAFGTKSAEKLREMGINAEMFIDGVTKQLSELPRVSGGLKNAIVNAGNSLTQFLGTVGDEIAKTFDLSALSEQLSKKLADLALWFKTLDGETKKTIITYGLYIAAAGPLLKVGSAIIGAGAFIINSFRGIASAVVGAAGQLTNFGKWWIATDSIMKKTVIGAVVAGALALYVAYNQINSSLKNWIPVYNDMVETQNKAAAAATEEKARIEPLVSVLKDNTATLENKKQALNELQGIAPKYFAGLDAETLKIGDLNKAYEGYINSIIRAAKAKAAEEKIIDLSKKQVNLDDQKKAYELRKKSVEDFAKSASVNGEQAVTIRLNIEKEDKTFADAQAALDAQKNALMEVYKANKDLEIGVSNRVHADRTSNTVTEESNKKKEKELDAFDQLIKKQNELTAAKEKALQVQQLLGIAPLEKLSTPGATQTNTDTGQQVQLAPVIAQFQGSDELLVWLDVFSSKIATLPQTITPAQAALSSLSASFNQLIDDFRDGGLAQEAVFDAVKNSVISFSNSGSTSLKDFANEALASSLKVAKGYAVEAVFAAARSAFSVLPFPINVVAAGAAARGAAALMNGLTNKIVPPKLAKGGVAYGETMATVGEYAGANINPEVIAPLKTLQGILGDSGSQNVTVRGVISGQDLLLVQERSAATRKRTTGR